METEIECNKDGHGECRMCPYLYADKACVRHISELTADMMLSQGVVVFPVKPGDTVYTINRGKIKEWKVYFVGINAESDIKFTIADEGFHNTYEFWDFNIGVCVFLTEEDAINELKERKSYEQT
jgi:hypothetical protein